MKYRLAFLVLMGCLCSISAAGGERRTAADSSRIEKHTVYKAAALTSAYYAASIYVLNNTWYNDKQRVPFHFYNDNKGYLQVDKFGHLFGSYVYSTIGYYGMLQLGASRNEALLFGSTLGFVLQLPIEIMDGIHEGYGFSWGDIAANTMGSALVLGQEVLFNEQVVKYKFSYWESPYARNTNNFYGDKTFDRLLKDYNGHTYWFSMPLNKLTGSRTLPPWLNIALGYSANGMVGEFENVTSFNGMDIPPTERTRQFLLSLDVDWSRIPTHSRVLKFIFKGMTFVKLPFPSLELNSREGLKGYWLYY